MRATVTRALGIGLAAVTVGWLGQHATAGSTSGGGGTANPCAAKNPCAAAAKKVDPKLISRPTGTRLAVATPDLVKEGERLWKDTKLSTNGLSCNTCHQGNASFNRTFARPYPHEVAMVKAQAGLGQVSIDEMVQMCMVVPMAARPLPWDSRELAALSAYSLEVQKTFTSGQARPGAANPCAVKNPCAANPCTAKNPCATRNPCAAR